MHSRTDSGKNMEVQHGEVIYRCYPGDGKLVMKFINMIKIFYELNTSVLEEVMLWLTGLKGDNHD